MRKLDIMIRQGSTFLLPVMWETGTLVYKPITAIAPSSPVRITAVAHDIPDGWNVAVMGVAGMTEMNAENNPPKDSEFHPITLVSDDMVEFNHLNASRFKAYIGGGQLVYYAPGDLTGVVVRMQIKDKIGGTVLHTLRSDGASPNILIDLVKRRSVPRIEASEAAEFTWKTGVYDLEIEDATGVVTPLLYGAVAVTREVTTIT